MYVYSLLLCVTVYCLGDQVLEWDGSSLQDATFEEARDIMSRSGDTVQVVLMHSRYDRMYLPLVHQHD